MVTASAKLLFSALLDSGNRSSLTISQTQCSLTSSLSFSHLKTVRAKTSSAHADSACLRWGSRFKTKGKKQLKWINATNLPSLFRLGIVPKFFRWLFASVSATYGTSSGRLPREQAALCCGDHLWTDQRQQALELLKGTAPKQDDPHHSGLQTFCIYQAITLGKSTCGDFFVIGIKLRVEAI